MIAFEWVLGHRFLAGAASHSQTEEVRRSESTAARGLEQGPQAYYTPKPVSTVCRACDARWSRNAAACAMLAGQLQLHECWAVRRRIGGGGTASCPATPAPICGNRTGVRAATPVRTIERDRRDARGSGGDHRCVTNPFPSTTARPAGSRYRMRVRARAAVRPAAASDAHAGACGGRAVRGVGAAPARRLLGWWLLLALQWPRLAARRAVPVVAQREPEADGGPQPAGGLATGGMWIAVMQFNLLPSVLPRRVAIDKVSVGGERLLLRALACMVAGCAGRPRCWASRSALPRRCP